MGQCSAICLTPSIDQQIFEVVADNALEDVNSAAWQSVFKKFDANCDGGFSVAEFFQMLQTIGAVKDVNGKTIGAVRKFMFSHDENTSRKLEFKEFCQVAEALKAGKVEGLPAIDLLQVANRSSHSVKNKADNVALQSAFAKFDKNSDGGLSVAEFFQMLRTSGAVQDMIGKSIAAVRKDMFSVDANNSRKIELEECCQVAAALKAGKVEGLPAIDLLQLAMDLPDLAASV
eukprot:gnl/MRDRNA2_/MRDRNA2_97382_c0_seq1.p1 gnl/MRDRNA2_/MRDRNA2_97382_c0~~gnl/MRDRNA2_/MRDRNA2_97382_c0_seq1.p1  ORF type:complete len:231 (+),score=60.81 gnl/MRDRNA2_/MRDRNA2_97382_c0_seq1:80-772(+)